MRLPFLTARWSNLFLATYAVPPTMLRPHLPPGLSLDLRDEQAFVSLVAFDFLDTRVLGIPWPGFRTFAELNLRFYVRRGDERGVVFIREFVPQRLVAWIARRVYNEPYLAAPLKSRVQDTPDRLSIEHRLVWNGQTHIIRATGRKPPIRPDDTSTEHFFKEHQWGYNLNQRGELVRYEVVHPVWDVYPLESYELLFDFGQVYGPRWKWLTQATPTSTLLAVGSPVAVYPHGKVG